MTSPYSLVQVSSTSYIKICFIKRMYKTTDGKSTIELIDGGVIFSDLCLHEVVKNYNKVLEVYEH